MHQSHIPFFLVIILSLVLLSCGTIPSNLSTGSEIILVDSFQVDYTSEIHVAAFHNDQGLFYNFKEGSFTQFDTTGKILTKKYFPLEGDNALGYVSGMSMKPDGRILVQTLRGEIAVLDDSLEVIEKAIFPFASVTPNLRSNIKSLDITGDEVYVYYPGKSGHNPMDKGYFKKSNLLEKINLTSGELTSVLNLSPESKFNQDLYFEDPYLHVSIWGERLYFAFDSEPMLYIYDLTNPNASPVNIPISPSKFIAVSGQPIPMGNLDGVYPGLIESIYPFEGGVAVVYGEGLEKATVDKLTNVHPKYLKSLQKNLLKIYDNEKGWSEEIALPSNVAAILGFENPSKVFYGLQNEALFDGNSGTVTIYRLRLSEIE